MSKPMFNTSRYAKAPLSRRLAEAIKDSIIHGKFKPGEALPPIRQLVEDCGRSAKVPRKALEILEAEGWTRPVRGVGSIVLDRGEDPQSSGRVLFYVRHTGLSNYGASLMAIIDAKLMAKGYKTFVINASSRSEALACRRLESRLREKWSLVALIGGGVEARGLVAKSGHPFVLLGDGGIPPDDSSSCVGRIGFSTGKALPHFVGECVRKNVKRVVQFVYCHGSFDAAGALLEKGIATETFRIGRKSSPAEVSRAAIVEMECILANGALPDLFLFTDDHIAQGGLVALAVAGIKVPRDVKVATHANKGFGPIWPMRLSRLEVDPVANGRALADAILAFLETGAFPTGLNLGSVWKKGTTM
ncbi:MAG: GntR family transcriptional regulator [Kiritimatiellae bacterium]|nr:GntR family transcriptional regulator [Kiritimatiellia bacterium]